ARAHGIGVELVDGGLDLGLRRGLGQVDAERLDADLRAVAVLARDVPLAAGVVADQDRAEAGDDTPLPQGCHAYAELVLDRGRHRLAVENLRCHGHESFTGTVTARPTPLKPAAQGRFRSTSE